MTNEKRVEKQHELFKLMQQNNCDAQDHIALYSRKHETAYLRQLCKQILPFILPENVLKCRLIFYFVRFLIIMKSNLHIKLIFRATLELVEEIAVSNLLLKGLDIIAEPESINQLVAKAIESHNEHKPLTILPDKKYVQFLKHWCQMNGSIFKSVRKFV
jgi:hypothetical protein